MYVVFYIGGIGERAHGDIGENALFTLAKREIPIGILLLSV